MPLTTLSYSENDHEHSTVAQSLGFLQSAVDKGTVYDDKHSYYSGHELIALGVAKLDSNLEYRKKDVPGKGKGGRTQNRVIIIVNKDTKEVVEGTAFFWRHDNRIYKLDKKFFVRANTFRNF